MIVVAAVGGNALLRRGERLGPEVQARNAVAAAASLAPLAGEHSLVITHGNGPQIGLLALESGSSGASPAYPLDVVGAESQGMIGYLLADQTLGRTCVHDHGFFPSSIQYAGQFADQDIYRNAQVDHICRSQ